MKKCENCAEWDQRGYCGCYGDHLPEGAPYSCEYYYFVKRMGVECQK